MSVKEVKVYWDPRKRCWYGKFKKVDTGVWTPKYVPVTHQLKADARIWFQDWLTEYERTSVEKVVPPEPKKTIRGLLPWWKEYLAQRGAQPEVAEPLPRNVDHYVLTHSIGDLDLEAIEAPQVEDWMRWLKVQPSVKTGKPLAPLSLQRVVIAIRTMVNDAIRLQKLPKNMLNPFRPEMLKVVMPKARRVHGRINPWLTKETVSALLQSSKLPYFRKVYYIVAIATGARGNELAGWKWKDLRQLGDIHYLVIERQLKDAKFGREECEYGPTKGDGGSDREVPLHPEAVKALQWWFETGWSIFIGRSPTPEDPIFPMPKATKRRRIGMPLRQAGVPGHWLAMPKHLRNDLKKAGQPDQFEGRINFNVKTFRKTFVTWLEMAHTTKERRDALMGHAGATVQDRNYIGRHLDAYYAEVIKLHLPYLEWSVKAPLDQAAE